MACFINVGTDLACMVCDLGNQCHKGQGHILSNFPCHDWPDDKQINILGKNRKNIQKADFVIRLNYRCRVVVLHFYLERIMDTRRLNPPTRCATPA